MRNCQVCLHNSFVYKCMSASETLMCTAVHHLYWLVSHLYCRIWYVQLEDAHTYCAMLFLLVVVLALTIWVHGVSTVSCPCLFLGCRFPMEHVTDAMAVMINRRVQGKVLITMGHSSSSGGSNSGGAQQQQQSKL